MKKSRQGGPMTSGDVAVTNDQTESGLVFVSYSHADREWQRRLTVMLNPVVRDGSLALWWDNYVAAGDRWRPEIYNALNRARAAVLLVSADFLASRFIMRR